MTYSNRYSIREWSHNALDNGYLHNDQIIFQKFVQEVNSGINFNNKKGIVDAIPIVAYHIIDDSQDPSDPITIQVPSDLVTTFPLPDILFRLILDVSGAR